MASNSAIEWTEVTWNPVTGCSKISAGCKNCYAERYAKRLKAMGLARYEREFDVALHEDLVSMPKRWIRPRMVFVNSMSDLFHEKVPASFIRRLFDTMGSCSQHIFQILTKRSERLRALAGELPWENNIWIGVTVEDSSRMFRIKDLSHVPAAVRFVSFEPLLGPMGNIPLKRIEWVIVGGESGPRARPMQKEWVDGILIQSREAGIPFFFKQWGGFPKKRAGRKLNGRLYDEFPDWALPGAYLSEKA